MTARICFLQRVREKALEDVVVLNADSNTLETPFDDMQALPPDVVSTTSSSLLMMEPPIPAHLRVSPVLPGVPAEASAKKGSAESRGRGVTSLPQSPGSALWRVPRRACLHPGKQTEKGDAQGQAS